MINQLKEFSFSHYILVIAGFAGLICPGLLYVMHFKIELLSSLDIFKLLLLSFTFSLPQTCLTSFVILYWALHNNDDLNKTANSLWLQIMAANIFFTILLLEVLLVHPLTTRDLVLVYVVLFILSYGSCWVIGRFKKPITKQHNPTN